jgi:hypothetical protein
MPSSAVAHKAYDGRRQGLININVLWKWAAPNACCTVC